MVVIRLSRGGSKHRPFFNIVVADKRVRRDGRFIENIGTYDPSRDASFKVDAGRLDYWKGVGAQPSPTVKQLLKKFADAAKAAAPAAS